MESKEKNTNNNAEQNDTKEKLFLDMSLSDVFYAGRYKPALLSYNNQLDANPNAKTKEAGAILVSELNDDGLTSTCNDVTFGSFSEIITMYSTILLKKLKKHTVPTQEAKEEALLYFMKYFIGLAKDYFFEEDEMDNIDDESLLEELQD